MGDTPLVNPEHQDHGSFCHPDPTSAQFGREFPKKKNVGPDTGKANAIQPKQRRGGGGEFLGHWAIGLPCVCPVRLPEYGGGMTSDPRGAEGRREKRGEGGAAVSHVGVNERPRLSLLVHRFPLLC